MRKIPLGPQNDLLSDKGAMAAAAIAERRLLFIDLLNSTYERQSLSLCGINAINNIIGYIHTCARIVGHKPVLYQKLTIEHAHKLSVDYVGVGGDVSEHINRDGWLSMELLTCIFSNTFGEERANKIKVFARADWNPGFFSDLYKEIDSHKNAVMLILGNIGGMGLHWWVAAKNPRWKTCFLVANLDTAKTSWDFVKYDEFMVQKINTVHVFGNELLRSILNTPQTPQT